jgi:hypothetical protein
MAENTTNTAERDNNLVRLEEIAVGGKFTYAGYDWVKLAEPFDGASPCLTAESVGDRAFDTKNHNDWRKSSLRKWLNDEFLKKLIANGAAAADFADVVSDLTADDGMTDYGEATDKIALLSCDLYRRYRAVIPALDDWWWTLTPWTCLASYSYYVRRVNASGALLSSIAYSGIDGVRPLCNLKSEILVSPVI